MSPLSIRTPSPVRQRQQGRRSQRGIALLVVIVLVMISALLALWSYQSSSLNEAMVGNDADYARAFEAAQAMLQDAESDISGRLPNGEECTPHAQNGDICRRSTPLQFVDEQKQVGALMDALRGFNPTCSRGLCLKRSGVQDFWNDAALMRLMTASNVAARYGQYSGAVSGASSNPILAERGDQRGAWYWIEVLVYEAEGAGGSLIKDSRTPKLTLTLNPSVIYRITAIARGLKPQTQVVLQSTYAMQTQAD